MKTLKPYSRAAKSIGVTNPRNTVHDVVGPVLVLMGLLTWIILPGYASSQPAPSGSIPGEISLARQAYSVSVMESPQSASDPSIPINVWTGNGPQAPIYALALDPANPNIIFAASGDGVFKSNDDAASWSRSDNGLTGGGVTALVIDPVNRDTVYAGTGGGVFKSADGGASWSAVNIGLTPLPVVALAIDPISPGTLYAASYEDDGVLFFQFNLFKSTNGGASWNISNSPFGYGSALAIEPGDPNVIYAGTQCGPNWDCTGVQSGDVSKSTNGGARWRGSDTRLVGLSIVRALAIDPANSKVIYAGGETCMADCGSASVFRSTDGGASWAASATGLPASSASAFAIDPGNPNIIYVGTDRGVFRSTDGGASWSDFNVGLINLSVHALVIDPSGARLHAGTSNGVFDYQYGTPCANSISPTNQSFDSIGGSGSASVTAPFECGWAATTGVSWISVTSSTNGSGNGTVSYSVAANDGAISRTGVLVLAGLNLTVTQAGLPPVITAATVSGKKLFVFGENFELGAAILLNGDQQNTRNDGPNPNTKLIGKKAGKKVKPGDRLQVRNPNGTVSQEFTFTGS